MTKIKKMIICTLTILLVFSSSFSTTFAEGEEPAGNNSPSSSSEEAVSEEGTAQTDSNSEEAEEAPTAGNDRLKAPILFSSSEPSGCAESPLSNMPEGELLFITLADDTNYKWNINDIATKSNVAHLDTVSGANCNFRLMKVDGEKSWYGIKHIKDGGADYYLDVEKKSDKPGKVLHLWEKSDDEVKGNEHRQFAFYEAGTDSNGNKLYYIKVRKSELWIGLEDNEIARYQKIVQTTADKAKKWYITPCTVPDRPDIYCPWTDTNESAICEIHLPDSLEAINIYGKGTNIDVIGTSISYYKIGISERWALNYIPEYKAYEIESTDTALFSYEQKKSNYVWDIPGETGDIGEDVHIWTKQSKKNNYNTSQLWRFIKKDGKIYIQNARTGLFLGYREPKPYSEEETYTTGMSTQVYENDAQAFDLQLLSKESSNIFYLHNELTKSVDWMKNLPDDALLSTINLPGTHDTGTASGFFDAHHIAPSMSQMSCQSLFYEEQLQVGARAFDIRANCRKSYSKNPTPRDVNIIHGNKAFICFDRDGTTLELQDILDTSVDFLKNNKTETIVLLIKPDDGSEDGLAKAILNFIKENEEYFYMGGDIPSVGEARGKIVLLRRFNDIEKDADSEKYYKALGFDLSNWDDANYTASKEAQKIYDQDGAQVWAQDAYKESRDEKIKYIDGTVAQTTSDKIQGNAYIFNYTSSAKVADAHPILIENARVVNEHFLDETPYKDGRLGIIMWNFIDETTSRAVYETNSNTSFMEAKATFPDEISITYGDTLSEATLSGQKGNGEFHFANESIVPNFSDVGVTEYEMIFTPKDTRLSPIKKNVKLTKMNPKKISIVIDDKKMTYGDNVPALTFSAEGLVGNDSEDELGVVLKIDKKDGEKLTAKDWNIIMSEQKNNGKDAKYIVSADKPGKLTVGKKQLSVKWSDTKKIVVNTPDEATWNKKGANVTAEINGVIDGDDCVCTVSGGDEKNPSWQGSSTTPVRYMATAKLSGKDS